MLDPLEPVVRRLLEECPGIKAPRVCETLRDDFGYTGSVDLVRKRMAQLRPAKTGRAAQRTGYRPGQVLQVDWAEMPTRPRLWGRRVYALICSLPFSGAATAHFSFDMMIEAFLEGHVRALDWLGGVPRELVYDICARRSRAATATRSGGTRGLCSCAATTPFTPRPARHPRPGSGLLPPRPTVPSHRRAKSSDAPSPQTRRRSPC